MWTKVLEGVLVIVVGALLKIGLAAIGVEIDPVLFNTIVAGIVLWILKEIGLETARTLLPRYFK